MFGMEFSSRVKYLSSHTVVSLVYRTHVKQCLLKICQRRCVQKVGNFLFIGKSIYISKIVYTATILKKPQLLWGCIVRERERVFDNIEASHWTIFEFPTLLISNFWWPWQSQRGASDNKNRTVSSGGAVLSAVNACTRWKKKWVERLLKLKFI